MARRTAIRAPGRHKLIIAPDGGDVWAPAKPRPDRDADPRAGTGASVESPDRRWDLRFGSPEIAEAEKSTSSYITRLLGLTLLAPDIIATIIDGKQPKSMGLNELTGATPSDWNEQKTRLRFSSRDLWSGQQ